MAMPLIIKYDYLPTGEDAAGNKTCARHDLKAFYELAFSPTLIIKGEWDYSKNIKPSIGTESSTSYTSITIAQEISAISEYIGFLKVLLGTSDDIKNKNFIYYKIESGKKAPSYLPINQQSFGISMYL